MKFGLYSIRDAKTGFMTPVVEPNVASATRNFYHSVQNSEGVLFTFAQDFALYRIADFDAETGQVIPLVPIVQVADGASAVAALRKE